MLSNGLLVYYYQSWHVAVNKLVLVIDLFIHACRSPLGKTPPVLFAILFSLHRSHPMYGRKFSNISLQYCYRRNRGYCLLIHKRFSQPLTQPQRKLCLFLVWDQGLSGIMLKRHTKCCSNTVLHHQVTLTVMTIKLLNLAVTFCMDHENNAFLRNSHCAHLQLSQHWV